MVVRLSLSFGCHGPWKLSVCTCYGASHPYNIQEVRINLVLIDHCHSLMLNKDGRCEEAASTNAYLQLRKKTTTYRAEKILCIFQVLQKHQQS